MSDPLETLAASPALYPFAYDPARDAFLFVPMEAADYTAASFLDERMKARTGQWIAAGAVARTLASARSVRPLHFIFHAGHVGSTLLSRLLDEAGGVLSLREPLPLRTVADAHDARMPGAEARLELLLRLWERGFDDTEAVILKATSATERLAATMLAMRPEARAVMLNVSAESYLATMLAGENSAADLNAQGPERLHRLGLLLGAAVPRPVTLGELAAMSWLAERLTQTEAVRRLGERILPVDFDAMLEARPGTLARVLAHFGIARAPSSIAAIADGPALARYSKAPAHGYSPDLRKDLLAQARSNFGREIRQALDWLEVLERRHPVPAALQ